MKNFPLSGFIYFLIFSSFPLLVSAQQKPTVGWDRSFGGDFDDRLSSMQPTADGGYILGGTTSSGLSGDKTQYTRGAEDYWLVKTDSKGNKQWDKTFGGTQIDRLNSIQQTPDGGYILAGESDSPISGDKSENSLIYTPPIPGSNFSQYADFWIIKLDNAGNKVWDKTIGGTQEERLPQIILTKDGGYLLAGTSSSSISGSKSGNSKGGSDFWIIKLDNNGNKLWDNTIGGNQAESLHEIKPTSDGGYILGGNSQSGIGGDKSQGTYGREDFWLVKIDAAGNKIWDKTFGGNDTDYLHSLKQTPDGGYILGGFSTSGINGDKSQPNMGSSDYWVVKTDANGNKQWDKTFGGNGGDQLYTLGLTSTGGYVLGGRSFSGISGDKSEAIIGSTDLWILNLDSAGNKLWDKTIGGTGIDFLSTLHETADGGFILGAESRSGVGVYKTQPSKGQFDYWLVKLNAPCTNLAIKVIPECLVGGTNLKLEVSGIQHVRGKTSWTLNYTENGVSKSITDSVGARYLAYNPAVGTVFALINITSGTCTTALNQTFTMPAFPDHPVAKNVSRCGTSKVSLAASGAPAGSKYVWYNVPANGTPLQIDSIGKFITPELKEPTFYYVAAQNNLGCEGPRTKVLASLNYCPPVFIPNIVTQNHDGKNDTFQPQNLPEGNWLLHVYNRWGTRIFESENYRNTWPEKKIPEGTYYYLLRDAATGQQFKGWVEVVH